MYPLNQHSSDNWFLGFRVLLGEHFPISGFQKPNGKPIWVSKTKRHPNSVFWKTKSGFCLVFATPIAFLFGLQNTESGFSWVFETPIGFPFSFWHTKMGFPYAKPQSPGSHNQMNAFKPRLVWKHSSSENLTLGNFPEANPEIPKTHDQMNATFNGNYPPVMKWRLTMKSTIVWSHCDHIRAITWSQT